MDAITRGRRNTTTVLKKLQVTGMQAALAVAMNTSEASISRLKTDHLEPVCMMLAHAGLKVVPVEAHCFPADEVNALLTIAKGRLALITSVTQLQWGDEEDRA